MFLLQHSDPIVKTAAHHISRDVSRDVHLTEDIAVICRDHLVRSFQRERMLKHCEASRSTPLATSSMEDRTGDSAVLWHILNRPHLCPSTLSRRPPKFAYQQL